MKIKFMVAATLMAALVTTTSCGNSNNCLLYTSDAADEL